jgi:hypothetical protein
MASLRHIEGHFVPIVDFEASLYGFDRGMWSFGCERLLDELDKHGVAADLVFGDAPVEPNWIQIADDQLDAVVDAFKRLVSCSRGPSGVFVDRKGQVEVCANDVVFTVARGACVVSPESGRLGYHRMKNYKREIGRSPRECLDEEGLLVSGAGMTIWIGASINGLQPKQFLSKMLQIGHERRRPDITIDVLHSSSRPFLVTSPDEHFFSVAIKPENGEELIEWLSKETTAMEVVENPDGSLFLRETCDDTATRLAATGKVRLVTEFGPITLMINDRCVGNEVDQRLPRMYDDLQHMKTIEVHYGREVEVVPAPLRKDFERLAIRNKPISASSVDYLSARSGGDRSITRSNTCPPGVELIYPTP